MSQAITNTLQEIVKRVEPVFPMERAYLFGSFAWGNPDDDSDLDLYFILPASSESSTQRAIRIRKLLRGLGYSLDILVKTKEEFNQFKELKSSLEYKIFYEGLLFYEEGKFKIGKSLDAKGQK